MVVPRRLVLVSALLVAAADPLARGAGAQDPRLHALREIEAVHVSVGTTPGPAGATPSPPRPPARSTKPRSSGAAPTPCARPGSRR